MNMKVKTVLASTLSVLLLSAVLPLQAATQTMIVAGGCFWCVESDFEKVAGVLAAVSGYSGGDVKNPTYKAVAAEKTGHFEVVKISFDDQKVSLRTLADYFWKTIDPTDPNGQFCDKGSPYKTAMFYQDETQKQVFEASLADVKTNKPFVAAIVTPILTAKPFYLAEDYHQDYYLKNPIRYNYYRTSCGRERKIEQLWGEVASKKINK